MGGTCSFMSYYPLNRSCIGPEEESECSDPSTTCFCIPSYGPQNCTAVSQFVSDEGCVPLPPLDDCSPFILAASPITLLVNDEGNFAVCSTEANGDASGSKEDLVGG